MLINALYYLNFSILIFFIIISMGYILLLITSIPDILLRFKEVESGNIMEMMNSYTLPPISIIIPAYNEEQSIFDAVRSIQRNKHLNTFIIIINDGSTDGMLNKLIKAYDLQQVQTNVDVKIKMIGAIKGQYISKTFKEITVIDKEHSDRSDSLNAALNMCKTPLVMTFDADSVIDEDAISRIVFYMLSRPNVVATGGAVYVLNGSIVKDGKILESKMSLNPIYAFQTCEYLRSFLFSKSGWNLLGGALCYSGTFTVFKYQALIEIGGFDLNNLAQDFEIITNLFANKYEKNPNYQISYTSAPVVWTDVPGTLKNYWRQRFNWQYATLQSLMPYKRMLFNPKYGIVGLFTYPFFLFAETLGAVVEFTAYLSVIFSLLLGVLNVYTAALFFMFCWGFLTLLTMINASINFMTFNKYKRIRDLPLMLLYMLIEAVGFRQFSVVCRTWATVVYFFGKPKVINSNENIYS